MLIGIVLSIVLQAAVAIFVYGKLTNEVSNHKDDIQELRLSSKDHETRISRLEGAQEIIH